MIKKMESKEYALGVERMDKEVGAPIDIAQSPMLMAALPVEPACMGKAVGEAGRPLMLCGARLYIITKV